MATRLRVALETRERQVVQPYVKLLRAVKEFVLSAVLVLCGIFRIGAAQIQPSLAPVLETGEWAWKQSGASVSQPGVQLYFYGETLRLKLCETCREFSLGQSTLPEKFDSSSGQSRPRSDDSVGGSDLIGSPQTVDRNDDTVSLIVLDANTLILRQSGEDIEITRTGLPQTNPSVGLRRRSAAGETVLHEAVRQANTAYITELAEIGVDPNPRDNMGVTPLLQAVRAGNHAAVERLVDVGADPNMGDKNGTVPLQEAVGRADAYLVNALLKSPATNANVPGIVDTSIRAGNREITATLIRRGAAVSGPTLASSIARDDDAMTDMLLAAPNVSVTADVVDASARSGDLQLVGRVLDRGGDPTRALAAAASNNNLAMVTSILDSRPVRPTNALFDDAVVRGRFPLAELFLDRGIDPNLALRTIISRDARSLVIPAVSRGANVEPALSYAVTKRDADLTTVLLSQHGGNATQALKIASGQNDLQIVRIALRYQANPNAAIGQSSADGLSQIVQELLASGADPDVGVEAAARAEHSTVLATLLNAGGDANLGIQPAVLNGNATLVKLLLESGAAAAPQHLLEAATQDNVTVAGLLIDAGVDPNVAMERATSYDHTEMTRLLLDRGADGTHPVYIEQAAQHNNTAIASMLLASGASPQDGLKVGVRVNAVGVVRLLTQEGASVSDPQYVMTAVANDRVQLAEVLFEAGAPTDARSSAGSSLVHLAAKKRNEQMLRVLVASGVNVNSLGANKETPVFQTVMQRDEEMTDALLALGADPSIATAKGETTLHVTARCGKNCRSLATKLVEKGADPNAVNAAGETVRDVADGRSMRKHLEKLGARKK